MKNTIKLRRQGRAKLCILLSFKLLQKVSLSWEQAPESYLYENYNNNYYMDIYSIFPNLIAKESYNWWLIRRILGFRQQKSEEKYLNVSVTNIGKH